MTTAAPPWSFAPERATFPLPGVSGGLLTSGMSFNKVAQGTPIMAMVPQQGPSPLQMWQNEDTGPRMPAGYEVGMPVRISNLLSPDCQMYNGMIGDIYEVRTESNPDGTQELLFEVRIPVLVDLIRSDHLVRDAEHLKVPISPAAQKAAPTNRAQVAPMYGVMATFMQEGDDARLPPFVLLSRLPSEKLEPLNAAAAATLAHGRGSGETVRTPGHASAPPPLVLQPKWGAAKPMTIEELPARRFEDSDKAAYLAAGGRFEDPAPQAAAAAGAPAAAAVVTSRPPPMAAGGAGGGAAIVRGASAAMAPPPASVNVMGMPQTWDPPTPPLSAAAVAPAAAAAQLAAPQPPRPQPATVVTTAQPMQQAGSAALPSGRFASAGGGYLGCGDGRQPVHRGVSMASSFYAGPTDFTKGGSFYAEAPKFQP